MNCPYCSASNPEDDHRCRRCGRRLGDDGLHLQGVSPFQHAATAQALSYESAPHNESSSELQEQRETIPSSQVRRPVYQPSLFGSRELPRVVSFESFAPESVDTTPKRVSRPRSKATRLVSGQQSFGFDTAAVPRHVSANSVDPAMQPAIRCDAPVALPVHRIAATVLDAFLVMVAVSIFIAVFRLAGGPILVDKHTLPLLAGVVAVFHFLYKIVWCLADGDSPGMSCARLKLVDLDGQPPRCEQRLLRMASGYLSLFAAGLGLIWALVDEESLTWHDHISKTFPTPY